MRTYIVTCAMPGYLPDGHDPVHFPSYRKARAYVMELVRLNSVSLTPHVVTSRGRVVSWKEYSHTNYQNSRLKYPTGYVWEVHGERVPLTGVKSNEARYMRYSTRCAWESCDPLTFDMWKVHGKPVGPV